MLGGITFMSRFTGWQCYQVPRGLRRQIDQKSPLSGANTPLIQILTKFRYFSAISLLLFHIKNKNKRTNFSSILFYKHVLPTKSINKKFRYFSAIFGLEGYRYRYQESAAFRIYFPLYLSKIAVNTAIWQHCWVDVMYQGATALAGGLEHVRAPFFTLVAHSHPSVLVGGFSEVHWRGGGYWGAEVKVH
jgi:hypothetical protein